MERVARCHCGQLRAIATGYPDRVYVCHCIACQRRTGAVVHSGAYYLGSQVRQEGVDKIYSRIGDSGRTVRFHFCPDCGTSVWWEGGPTSGHRGVAVGCFGDPGFWAPTYSLYEEGKHPWLGLPASVRDHFEGTRPPDHIPDRPWKSQVS